MCRSKSSGESPRRCPCASSNKRSAYERGIRAATKAGVVIPAEEIGLSVDDVEKEIPYEQEVAVLVEDIKAVYFEDKRKRLNFGEDEELLTNAQETYGDDVETKDSLDSVIRLGHLIAKRAEEIAGITAEEIRARADIYIEEDRVNHQPLYQDALDKKREWERLRTEHNDLVAKHGAQSEPSVISSIAAKEAWDIYDAAEAVRRKDANRVSGNLISVHDKSYADLERLSVGYLQALREIRPFGGDMLFNNERDTVAVKMFKDAAQVFPTDWIEYSNVKRIPFARNLGRRAHYSEYAEKRIVKREPEGYVTIQDRDYEPQDDTPTMTTTRLTGKKLADYYGHEGAGEPGETVWQVNFWSVASWHQLKDDGTPKGTGWSKYDYVNRDGETVTGYRKKLYRQYDSYTESVPEITTTIPKSAALQKSKRHSGYAVAVHELSHRFEFTVPEIVSMESDFYESRTTNEDGSRNPLFTIYKHTSEKAREGGFVSKYMGKEYPDVRAYEVLSTGTEALFGGAYGGLVGVGKNNPPDEHMRSFVLGVLATAGTRYKK